MKFMNMLEKNSALIGMVHCLPLPGTMNYAGSMDAIIEKAVSDAKTLEKAGFDAILTEPTLDLPSGMARGQLQLAAMSIICKAVSTAVSLPTGVSYLTPDCMDMFSIAKACGAGFVRLTTFVDTMIFPPGVSYPSANRVWEVRRQEGMRDIAVLADIQVKHGTMMYPETRLEESAYFAEKQGADAIIVTGRATGEETPIETIQRVKRTVKIPVIVGSGVSVDNIQGQMPFADGFIIGSSIKNNGKLEACVDEKLAAALVSAKNK
ncbi:MAG: BtpA/SgcQ family protein [Muricomes sp.]|uniref:BtpA/SgcQ family protein n=1 Tax=Faecalicatena contorta TaxID=39482 RepID=UPI002EC8C9F1|nr:BtpA/SgcQ family protein [Muricomes sp.]